MKTSSLRKGFTLVEIMIVVVIIGLLAALAIPAFKKVRNNAIEKTLINDARQLASAANQIASEQATTMVTFTDIKKYISGGQISTGVLIDPAGGTTFVQFATLATEYFTIGTTAAPYFSLAHPNYSTQLSSSPAVTSATQSGTNERTYLIFDTNDGRLK